MDRFLSITSSTPNKRICLENVDDPPPPAVDVPAPLPELKFQYLFDTVYKLVSINGDKIKASCQNCHKIITAYTTSSGNLLSHIKVSFHNICSNKLIFINFFVKLQHKKIQKEYR